MSNELKKLETAQQALSDAKEINAAEALTISQSKGHGKNSVKSMVAQNRQ